MDKVFKWFTLDDEHASARVTWFASTYGNEEFTGVNRLLVCFLEYCSFLGIHAKRQYLESFLATDGKECIKKYNIKLDTMDSFDYKDPASLEEACRVVFATALSSFDEYDAIDLADHKFKVDMFEFIRTQKSSRVMSAMMQTFPVLQSGDSVDDTVSSLEAQLALIQQKYDVRMLDKLDFLTGEDKDGIKERPKMRKLFDTGIPCIDGDTGGVFSKQVHTFTGQPGSGKSRWAFIHYAYQCAVLSGRGVYINELELQLQEVENILIAHHIIKLYGGKVKIPDSLINTGRLTPEQSRYVESARIDLFESGKYGRIVISTEPVNVEELEKNMYSYLKHNRDIELWIVDYIGLFSSRPIEKYSKHLQEFEVITEGYKIAKGIAKNADIAVCVVNQFNEKGIMAAYAGKMIIPGYVQGGHIIQRHSDYDYVMCMTEEQEIAGIRTLSTVKKRAATGFHNVPFSTDLSVSIFRQQRVDATN